MVNKYDRTAGGHPTLYLKAKDNQLLELSTERHTAALYQVYWRSQLLLCSLPIQYTPLGTSPNLDNFFIKTGSSKNAHMFPRKTSETKSSGVHLYLIFLSPIQPDCWTDRYPFLGRNESHSIFHFNFETKT